MKTLIAYYSRTGANEKLAKELVQKLKCDMEKIEGTKSYAGPPGFIRGGRDAKKRKIGRSSHSPRTPQTTGW